MLVHRLIATAATFRLARVARGLAHHRPIRSPKRSSAERIGAPAGPVPAGDPSRRQSPTIRPHRQQVGVWGRVVGLCRETEERGGAGRCQKRGAGTEERMPGGGRKGCTSPDVCRAGETSTPYGSCETANDCSRRLRSPNGSGSPSATCGGWDAKASCRGSSCRGASTCASPRRTSRSSSPVRVASQRQDVRVVPRRHDRSRVGSEVER
jgi:hypothetical protein